MRFPLVAPLAAAAFLVSASPSLADWQVNSDFMLHITEDTFDKMIQDFWTSLQGTQKIAVGNIPVNLGDTQLAINGVNVAVNYSFPLPTRVTSSQREWELKSNQVSATVSVNQLLITVHKTIFVGGIPVDSTATAECDNLSMNLPAGAASIDAIVQARVAQNQVQLSMPSYQATWPSGAWQLQSLNCPALAGIGGQVQSQILAFLANFQNVDNYVSGALASQFQKWSAQASVLLLSQQQLPTGVDYLNVYYQPETAVENNGNGLILGGKLQFVYPYVSQGQHIEQDFALPSGSTISDQTQPQLLIPFNAIKAMMMGEYFAGKMEYTIPSSQVAGFQTLMNSWFAKLFGWPDLLHFDRNTAFLFQALPMGPPSFDGETAGGPNEIKGNLNQPLSLRMYAPDNNVYTPYVEFRTLLSGPTSMTLNANGQIAFKITAADEPVSYAFATTWTANHSTNTHIAASTIAKSARTALNTDGLNLSFPPFKVGSALTLVANQWQLLPGGVLQLGFNATSLAITAAKTVNTTNGKRLTVAGPKP
jgi:hypothetical protein